MTTNDPATPRPRRRFQFRLIELFVFMTSACVTFALLGRFGIRGFTIRLVGALFLVSPLLPLLLLLDFYHRWRGDKVEF